MNDERELGLILANVGDMGLKRRVKMVIRYLDVNDKDRILDCGCGEGFYLKVLSRLANCELYGLDDNDQVLERAREELKDTGVVLKKGNIYNLPYKDCMFDKVVLSEVLEHVPDDVAALKEVRRVLKPNGILVVTVPNHNYPFLWDPVNKLLEVFLGKHIESGFWAGVWNMHLRLYCPDEICNVIEHAGYQVAESDLLTHYCIPFNHICLNGLKRLLNKGILPGSVSDVADKFACGQASQSLLNPVAFGYRLLDVLDRPNDNIMDQTSSVSIVVKATK